jgi:hypothetical protein
MKCLLPADWIRFGVSSHATVAEIQLIILCRGLKLRIHAAGATGCLLQGKEERPLSPCLGIEMAPQLVQSSISLME